MEPRGRICEDDALLLAYAAGAVGAEESKQVGEHVLSCSRCEKVVRENRTLARAFTLARQESLHPSPEVLTQAAESRQAERAMPEVWSHVTRCEECRHIVSVLQRVERDHAPARAREALKDIRGSLSQWWREFQVGMAIWLKGPVPAYLLILLLLYPAYVGLLGRSGMPEGVRELESPTLLSAPRALESEAQRGPERIHIELDRTQGQIVLSFLVPVAPERYRYSVELLRGGETLFVDPDAKSFDGVGTFTLLFPGGFLKSGDYTLKVQEIDRQREQTTAVQTFPFTISK